MLTEEFLQLFLGVDLWVEEWSEIGERGVDFYRARFTPPDGEMDPDFIINPLNPPDIERFSLYHGTNDLEE